MGIDDVKVAAARPAVPRWQAVAAVLVILATVVFATFAFLRLSDIKDAASRNACSDRLIGYAFDAAARTLAAPPAPSAARVATANDFVAASHRLSNADAVCSATDNKPKPLRPT